MFCVTPYLLFESFSSAKNIFLLKVRETSGSPVGLRSAGKGTIVEFKRFLVLLNYMNLSTLCYPHVENERSYIIFGIVNIDNILIGL